MCTKYLLTQWAAVRATWGWMSEAPHWNRLNCVPPPSGSSPLSRASIHGNSPNCVKLSSLNIRSRLEFIMTPLMPHESGGGSSAGLGDGDSLKRTSSPPSRILQHTCTPGHRLSPSILPSICILLLTSTLCTHNITSDRYLAEAMVWSQYRGGGTGTLILNWGDVSSGIPKGVSGGLTPPWNSKGPPKSCQTQPDCENC